MFKQNLKFSTERKTFAEIPKDINIEQLQEVSQKTSPIILKDEEDLFAEMGIRLGLNIAVSFRKEKCEIIERRLKKDPVLLIKGTRATGKTSMGRAFGVHVKKQNKGFYYLNVATPEIKTIEDLWKKIEWALGNRKIGEVAGEDSCFVIDEIQKIYDEGNYSEFWEYIKTFIDTYDYSRTKFKFLFLSNYVSISTNPLTKEKFINITPLSLRDLTLPISFLFCTPKEMDEINISFNREMHLSLPGFKISDEIKDYIFEQSGAHIGVIHHYYRCIYYKFKKSFNDDGKILNEGDIIGYLRSSAFAVHLSTYRGFLHYDSLNNDIDSKKILTELFLSEKNHIPISSAIFDKVIFKKLVADGILITEDEHDYTWAFPFQRTLMLKYIFQPEKRNAKLWRSEQLDDFIRETLTQLSGKSISVNISSAGGDHLLERPIQRVVGTSFNSLLDPKHTIHYEISANTPYNKDKYLRIEGFMDFFINNELGWAIELIVEKNKPYEHLYRLLLGKYSIDKTIKGSIVIHFLLREAPDLKSGLYKLPKGMWNVIFNKDITVATVVPWNNKAKSPTGEDNWSVINEKTGDAFDVRGYYGNPFDIYLVG